ncbi:MAG: phosphotransferase [Spirochaetales bacterium]|nr:phosphotransferase [Spirochaetales bacterium]
MKSLPDFVKNTLSPRFGADPPSIIFLGGGQDWSDGIVFRFEHSEGERVIKFVDFAQTDDKALFRMEEKILYIKRMSESGTSVIEPELSVNGNHFEICSFEGKNWLAYSYPYVPGRPVNAGDTVVRNGMFHRHIGTILGKLHTVASELPEEGFTANKKKQSLLSDWTEEWEFFRSWCRDDEVGSAWERLKHAVLRLDVERKVYGFIHNDAHAANFIFNPASATGQERNKFDLTLIDFDVARFHFFTCEVAAALYSFVSLETGGLETIRTLDKDRKRFLYSSFMKGYEQFRSPLPEWLDHLRLFIQYRRCLLFMPFQEQTAKYPAWRKRWKKRIMENDKKLFG